MSSSKTQVLTIRAGPGGLVLAHALQKNDISFEIFERDSIDHVHPQGWAVALHEYVDIPQGFDQSTVNKSVVALGLSEQLSQRLLKISKRSASMLRLVYTTLLPSLIPLAVLCRDVEASQKASLAISYESGGNVFGSTYGKAYQFSVESISPIIMRVMLESRHTLRMALRLAETSWLAQMVPIPMFGHNFLA